MLSYHSKRKKGLRFKKAMKTAIPPYCKNAFVMNQKHVFGYRFLVTNRNVIQNTPQIIIPHAYHQESKDGALCVLTYFVS